MIPAESIDVVPLSWQPEAPDYAEAFRARNRKRGVGWLALAMCALGTVFAVAAFLAGEPGIAIVGVVIAVFFALMGRVGTNFLYNRNPELHQPVQLTVDARAGIAGDIPVADLSSGAMRVKRGRWQFPWEQVAYVLETNRAWVVHLADQNGKVFFLIAKRGVTDPQQAAVLQRLLTR